MAEQETDFLPWDEFETYFNGLEGDKYQDEVKEEFGKPGLALLKNGLPQAEQVKQLYKLHLADIVEAGNMKRKEADELLKEIGLAEEEKEKEKVKEKKASAKKGVTVKEKEIKVEKKVAKKETKESTAKKKTKRKSRLDLYNETGAPAPSGSAKAFIFKIFAKRSTTIEATVKAVKENKFEVRDAFVSFVVREAKNWAKTKELPIEVVESKAGGIKINRIK